MAEINEMSLPCCIMVAAGALAFVASIVLLAVAGWKQGRKPYKDGWHGENAIRGAKRRALTPPMRLGVKRKVNYEQNK